MTEVANCVDAGKVEIAAYAYDLMNKPKDNIGTLLKEFTTLIDPNVWYRYRLTFDPTITTYELMSDDWTVLETITIDHTECVLPEWGYSLTLYFGGVCKAP